MILDCIQALPAIHAIMVPMNIRLTKPEVDYILEHSGSSAIIVDRDFVHLTKGFKGLVIVSNDTGGKDREDPYEQVIAEGQQDADTKGWQSLPLIADEEAGYAICYTSGESLCPQCKKSDLIFSFTGTTGRPKGVLTTYRGTYLSGLANAYQAEMTASSVYLWILPAFHAVGWTYPIAITAAGSGQVCLRSVGDYTPIWDSFLRDGITVRVLISEDGRVRALSYDDRRTALLLLCRLLSSIIPKQNL
jgi:acyl-CoA synthetase (AMP-forming)/AMP-acid ligase II